MTGPHPLDPLTAEEIGRVAAVLRRERDVTRPQWRVAAIELREPAKDVVRSHRPGDRGERWRGQSCGTPATGSRTWR